MRRRNSGNKTKPSSREALTPVQAVPAKAQANGKRYHGDMAMRYKLKATDVSVMATALHAFHGLKSKTCITATGQQKADMMSSADHCLIICDIRFLQGPFKRRAAEDVFTICMQRDNLVLPEKALT